MSKTLCASLNPKGQWTMIRDSSGSKVGGVNKILNKNEESDVDEVIQQSQDNEEIEDGRRFR